MASGNGVFESNDILQHVCAYLEPRSLARAMRACRAWMHLLSSDDIWFELSSRRWGLGPKYKPSRLYGSPHWRGAYTSLACSQRLPRGKFTNKHNIVFGRGRANGVDCWVTLGHSNDCRTARRQPSGDGKRVTEQGVELRVVVQNVRHDALVVDMTAFRVLRKPRAVQVRRHRRFCCDGHEAISLEQLEMRSTASFPRVMAFNGATEVPPLLCNDQGQACLPPLSFAVFGVLAICPGCEFETDFLAGALCVEVPVRVANSKADRPPPEGAAARVSPVRLLTLHKTFGGAPSSLAAPHGGGGAEAEGAMVDGVAAKAPTSGGSSGGGGWGEECVAVRAFFLDEQEVMGHYSELPGGCLTLLEKSEFRK